MGNTATYKLKDLIFFISADFQKKIARIAATAHSSYLPLSWTQYYIFCCSKHSSGKERAAFL